MLKTLLGGIGLALPIIATISGAALSQKITMEAVNEAIWKNGKSGSTSAHLIKLQVLLDPPMPHLEQSTERWARTPEGQLPPSGR